MKTWFFTKESFTGRHSFDLRIYFLLAPIAILVVPFIDSDFSSASNFLWWTFASSMGYILQLIFIKFAQIALTQKANFKPFQVWKIFVIGALLGAMRGSVTFKIALFLGLPTTYVGTLGLRTIIGAIAGLTWVPCVSLVSNNIFEIRSRRNLLMESLLQQRSLLNENQVLLLDIKKVVREAIENDVSELLTRTRKEIKDAQGRSLREQYEEISQVLIFAAEKLVRPMSHKLMEDTRLIFPSPSLRSILLIALRNPILPTLPILLVNNIAVLLVFVPESHSLLNLVLICCLQLISTLLIIKLVTFTYKKFMGSRFQWSIGPQILIIIYLLLKLNKYFMQALVSNNFSELLAQRFFLNFVWILYLMFFTSFLANMLENGSAIQAFVLQLIASDKVDELLVHEETLRVKHDIARYLHGNLQSRIMSLGLTMNMNVTKNQESMDSAMTIASSLLDSPFGEYLDTQERSLDDEVFYYVAKWDGLLEIKTEISEHTIVLTAVQKRAIGSALEEALANALRHGFAKSVQIHIFQEGVDLIVQVLDDGIGPRKSEAGLGSRLYDQISAKGWSLQHRINDEGTVLELRL